MADPAKIIQVIGEVGIAVVDRGARRSYEKKVNELTTRQQEQLAKDLLAAKTDAERLRILNEATAQAKNQGALNKIALSRNIGFVILGVGLLALGVAIIYTRKKA